MSLEDSLRDWLPRQRWFAGKDRVLRSVLVSDRRRLVAGRPDEPALYHALIDVEFDDPVTGSEQVRYQVLLGGRASLPPQLDHARIGHAADLGEVYDAVHDQQLMGHVLRWVADDETRAGVAFRREPGAVLDLEATSLVLGAEQSNTSVVFGDQTILKLFRIIVPGVNPDLEVTRALTEAGNEHVAAVQGWVETELDGAPATLGMLQEFLRTGSDGWALALTSVRDLFAEGDLHAEEVGGDFAAESERLGFATADVHLAMAQALPSAVADTGTRKGVADAMRARLDSAVAAVPALAAHAPAIAAVFDRLENMRDPLPLQRVHGDLHLGQVLRTGHGWVLLDFEGEPGAPIESRAALSSPLRDVAGMLRSFDYAAHYLLADHASAPHLEYRASEWSERNRDAFCTGYAKTAGRDPRDDDVVLRAFELDKAVYEVVYEARNRPHWVGIPLASVERLLVA